MAGTDLPSNTRGGRRTVDFHLNLVPMIDLLSVLIAFLLITAVWTDLARLKASSQTPAAGAPPSTPPPPPLIVRLEPGRTALAFADDAPTDVADDAALAALLARLSARLAAPPERQPVKLLAADAVPYRKVVSALDVLTGVGLTQVKIGPVEGP